MNGVSFSEDEQRVVEALAERRGYHGAKDYLKALIANDLAAHGEPSPFDEIDDRSMGEIHEGIKESLKQAFRGETVPLDSLWDDDER